MNKLIDCTFFLTSSCLMGNRCRYRHSEQAKSTQTVCPLFKERKCSAVSCKFRHPKNKNDIPCIFESKPGGCRRNNCFFTHTKIHFRTNPYIIDQTLSVQSEVGEKNTQNIAADSQEKMQLHRLFTASDLYSTAYDAAPRKTPQHFKHKKAELYKSFSNFKMENKVMGNPYSLNFKKKPTVEALSEEKGTQGNSKSLNFKIKTLTEIQAEKKQNQGKRKFLYETEDECKKIKTNTGIVNKENKVCCVKDLRPFNDHSKIPVSHRIPAILDSEKKTYITQ